MSRRASRTETKVDFLRNEKRRRGCAGCGLRDPAKFRFYMKPRLGLMTHQRLMAMDFGLLRKEIRLHMAVYCSECLNKRDTY
jgi:hypothetical protein